MSHTNEQKNIPTATPTLEGPFGKAWKLGDAWKTQGEPEISDEKKRSNLEFPRGTFLVHAPGAHPFWSYYYVALVSLHNVDGLPPARKQFPEATHEFTIFSLDPDGVLPNVDGSHVEGRTLPFLEPPDQVVQFVADDTTAKQVLDLAVDAIVRGGISPDRDYRGWWRRAIPKTVEHIALGGHPIGGLH